MDEALTIFNSLKEMVDKTTITQAVNQAIAAYDGVAVSAMQTFIAREPDWSPEEIAVEAWKVADAMMVERKKRGFGSV